MSCHIVVLPGSNRSDSQSVKSPGICANKMIDLKLYDSNNHLIDLASSRLPLWPGKDIDRVWSIQQSILGKATALIVICPE